MYLEITASAPSLAACERTSLYTVASVTACRADDGHLLLISWQLKADGTLTRLADSGTRAEDIGKAHCLGHFSERRFRATTRR
jgi:hypothetical protein